MQKWNNNGKRTVGSTYPDARAELKTTTSITIQLLIYEYSYIVNEISCFNAPLYTPASVIGQ